MKYLLFVLSYFFYSGALAQSIIDKGRQVYIQEGCINCHSQFVRPGTRDIEMWGPLVDKEEILSALPPLIGNRRLGPDLLNVGNRRSEEWLELHMIYPRLLSPGSRMPSYAYLFNDNRGKDLLFYLKSLGAKTAEARVAFINSWKVRAEPDKQVNVLYANACAQCHAPQGVAGKMLKQKPHDFKIQKFIYVNKASIEDLAKAIKFGIYGTSMPGHEYLSDSQVVGLAKYVQTISGNN